NRNQRKGYTEAGNIAGRVFSEKLRVPGCNQKPDERQAEQPPKADDGVAGNALARPAALGQGWPINRCGARLDHAHRRASCRLTARSMALMPKEEMIARAR